METTGYDVLVAAGLSLAGTELLDGEAEPSDADIAQFVSTNREALQRARHALQRRCAVPLEYSATFFEKHQKGYPALRDLCRGFALELKAAERQGDLPGALAIGLNIFDLANAVRRGGLVLDLLVAIAIEGIAIDRVRGIRRHLKPEEAVRLANELLRIDAEREAFDCISARDRQWEEAVCGSDEDTDGVDWEWPEDDDSGLDEESKQAIKGMVQAFAALPDDKKCAFNGQLDNGNLALLRLLAIDSALTCFQGRNGSHAPLLSSLVPDCIATIPLDPFTGGEFKYLATPAGFVLCSPGPGKRDLGGKFGSWFSVLSGEADLAVDMHDYDDAD